MIKSSDSQHSQTAQTENGSPDDCEADEEDEEEGDDDPEVFEVEKVLAICYGDPKETKKPGLHLKVSEHIREAI